MNSEFSIIILTLNEEQHLPRLLRSTSALAARTYVLDSGSTDRTLAICEANKITHFTAAFENHPKQWHTALTTFQIETPWLICLDADQEISPALFDKLKSFHDADHQDIEGIYFNRKNIFKGKWIRNGGFYPKYLLKMFRYKKGYSDLNENMDHRFVVPGKTVIWKEGLLIEENLKENEISFWINKHNRYSELVAIEEIERMECIRTQVVRPNYWGSPDERTAWLKRMWWQLPRYIRPFIYLFYRLVIQRGIMDGKTGIIYHFLQGFWFRLIIDIKIEEKLRERFPSPILQRSRLPNGFSFMILFPITFLMAYTSQLAFIGATNPDGIYIAYLDQYFNYISLWRTFTIQSTAFILEAMKYDILFDDYTLHVTGRSGFRIVYSCLGYGILSIYGAFILTFPNKAAVKFRHLLIGIISFQCLNTIRLVLIALYWKPAPIFMKQNAHELFNYSIYLIIGLLIYMLFEKRAAKSGGSNALR